METPPTTGAKLGVPAGLAAEGQRLWDEVTASYQLRPDERRLLEEACREVDLIEAMQKALPKRIVVKGSMQQPVVHPLVGELRQHRMALNALLRQLKLTDLLPASGGESHPTASDTGTSARKAAIARWGRSG